MKDDTRIWRRKHRRHIFFPWCFTHKTYTHLTRWKRYFNLRPSSLAFVKIQIIYLEKHYLPFFSLKHEILKSFSRRRGPTKNNLFAIFQFFKRFVNEQQKPPTHKKQIPIQAHKNQLTKRKETNGGMTSMMKKIVGAYIFFFLFFSYTNFNIYNKEKHNSEPRQIREKRGCSTCVYVCL